MQWIEGHLAWIASKQPMASVFVSCCHHVPQLGGLTQQKKIYFVMVLKAISLKSRCGHGYALSEGSRKESALCLSPSSQSSWQSLACRHILHHHMALLLSLYLFFSLLWGYQSYWIQAFPYLVGVSYSLVTFATTWFSKKVIFWSSGKNENAK